MIDNSEAVEEFFEHHGIKGMKWGVRRSRAQLAAARERAVKKSTKTTAKVDKATYKQNVALGNSVKRIGRKRNQKILTKRVKQTNRAIKKDMKVDRLIKKYDKKISRMDQKTIRDGERFERDLAKREREGA